MPGVQSQVRVVHVRIHKPAVRMHAVCSALLVLLAMGCVMALCFCGAYIVKPYRITHFFEETNCTTTKITWEDKYAECCITTDICEVPAPGVAGFPCIEITVSFEDGGKSHSAMVYKDDKTWGMDTHCSYPLCDSYGVLADEHTSEVDYFAEKYKEGNSYACLFDPKTGGEVIIERKWSRMQVFHSMFWPSLVFVLCVVGFCFIRNRPVKECRNTPGFTRL